MTYLGCHTNAVQKGLNIGVGLFILSEALFFLSIFWAFFHSALSPNIELGTYWPPMGIQSVNPFELPLLNTVLLLSSGVTITWAHHSLIQGNRKGALYGTIFTVLLAVVFTFFQGVEYTVSSFTISDSVFGSCFYFATGLIFGAPYISKRLLSSNKNVELNPWVTGFADAESTFSIRISKDKSRLLGIKILPIFSIELHIRDIYVLERIKSFFNVGSVTVRERDGRKYAIYSVQSISSLISVIIPRASPTTHAKLKICFLSSACAGGLKTCVGGILSVTLF